MLVEAGTDLIMFDEKVAKLLHVAAQEKITSIVPLLLETYADVTIDIQPMDIFTTVTRLFRKQFLSIVSIM